MMHSVRKHWKIHKPHQLIINLSVQEYSQHVASASQSAPAERNMAPKVTHCRMPLVSYHGAAVLGDKVQWGRTQWQHAAHICSMSMSQTVLQHPVPTNGDYHLNKQPSAVGWQQPGAQSPDLFPQVWSRKWRRIWTFPLQLQVGFWLPFKLGTWMMLSCLRRASH